MRVFRKHWLAIGVILAGCSGAPLVAYQEELIVGLRHDVPWTPPIGSVVNRFTLTNAYVVVRLPQGVSAKDGQARLESDPEVLIVRLNRTLPVVQVPNDPMYSQQWALERVNIQPCWDRKVDTSQILIAVLDTGIDDQHPDLAGRIVRGYNFVERTGDSIDNDGHGTHVAGIIGAIGNNSMGMSGLLPNAKILSVKVLSKGGGSDAWALEGIKYAVDKGAKVINMSFNSSETQINPLYTEGVEYARSRGVLVVAAAGNNGSEVTYPANTPGCIAVSATGYFRRWEWIAPFSNRGDCVAFSAPGAGILSTMPGSKYEVLSGTSMAAPFVTAAVAMLIAQHPTWTLQQVESRLRGSVDDLGVSGRDPLYGYGRINMSKLLD